MSENTKQKYIEKMFHIINASSLTPEDKLFQYKPENDRQYYFKKDLISAIESGLTDFRAPRLDPSFDENKNICYKPGVQPITKVLPKCWDQLAKAFMPEKNSRLGTVNERFAFLGFLLKYLIEKRKYCPSTAWKVICNDSKKLGNYMDSRNASVFLPEPTGNRGIGEWYDLANTCKLTKQNVNACGFSLFGGNFRDFGREQPLASQRVVSNQFNIDYSVGWIILDA